MKLSTLCGRGRVGGILVIAFLLFQQTMFAAESGTIRGRVMDKNGEYALPGANVLIVNTNLGASTDLDGKFTISNAPTGNQTLRVSYVGYLTTTASVSVPAGGVVEKEFRLTPQAVRGDTIVVTAQAQGQSAAINQQLASNNIINVVSAEKMKELPDANIAESIGRLPGISLQRNAGEAYAVVVRGLSPKYNEVTIEGIPMSSTNYFDRGIDLSLLSDDVVRSVEVSKTLRPDLDADALGGTVNLTLKSADPGVHYTASGNGAYNDLRKTGRNYKFTGSVSNRFFDDQFGVLLQGNIEQKQLPSDQFSATYSSPANTSQFYVNTSTATLTQSNLARHRYGLSGVVDFSSDMVDVKALILYDQKRDSSIQRTYQSQFQTNSLYYTIIGNETKTEQVTGSLSVLFKNVLVAGAELPVSVSYTNGKANIPNSMEFDFTETAVPAIPASMIIYGDPAVLINRQGVMDPTNANTTLTDMSITNSHLTDKSFDAKIDWKVPFRLSDFFSGKLSAGAKVHGVERRNVQGQVHDYLLYGKGAGNRSDLIDAYPFLAGLNKNLQAGIPASPFPDAGYSTKSILGYPIGPGFNVNQLLSMQTDYYFGRSNILRYDINGAPTFNQYYVDFEHTAAGYAMGEFNVGTDITIVPGVRYQEERTTIRAYRVKLNGANQNGLAGEPPRLIESNRVTPNWYPSVNIKYKVTQDIQILGAAYRSVSLPSYGEITPRIEYSLSPTAVATANPLVKPSTAWNFDFGATLANNDIGLVTVNLFYKEISDLIYTMQNYMPFLPYPVVGAPADIWDRLPGPNSGYFDTSWATANGGKTAFTSIPMNDPHKAFLRGIEISWQTHLWYLPGVLSGIVLDLNASFMSSRQIYPAFADTNEGTLFRPIHKLYYRTVAGALQDQPKATYNAILGWDYMGFSSRFSLRYQQQTLRSIDTQFKLQNSYYDNVMLFDIALKQQLIDNLSVFANATNLNGHIDNYYFVHPTYQTHPEGSLPTNKQTYGWAVQFGVNFNY